MSNRCLCHAFTHVLLKDDFIDCHETITIIDESFTRLAVKKGITSNPRHFASISIEAMKHLQMEKKPNLVYKFSEMLTLQKSGNPAEPVIQLGQMPFGLIEYVIQFLVTPHVKQVYTQFFNNYTIFIASTIQPVLPYTLKGIFY